MIIFKDKINKLNDKYLIFIIIFLVILHNLYLFCEYIICYFIILAIRLFYII